MVGFVRTKHGHVISRLQIFVGSLGVVVIRGPCRVPPHPMTTYGDSRSSRIEETRLMVVKVGTTVSGDEGDDRAVRKDECGRERVCSPVELIPLLHTPTPDRENVGGRRQYVGFGDFL